MSDNPAFAHSPTPWRTEDEGREIWALIETRIASLAGFPSIDAPSGDDVVEANARRIVAAVNATADIPIGVLELMAEAAQKRYEKEKR